MRAQLILDFFGPMLIQTLGCKKFQYIDRYSYKQSIYYIRQRFFAMIPQMWTSNTFHQMNYLMETGYYTLNTKLYCPK